MDEFRWTDEQLAKMAEIEERIEEANPYPGRSYYYDRAGRPITLGRFSALTEVGAYRLVRHTHLESPGGERTVMVSTVWLGIDHNIGLAGPPLIFETMIFGDTPLEDEQDRYPTEQSAIDGHRHWVHQVLTRSGPWQPDRNPGCEMCELAKERGFDPLEGFSFE